MIEIPAGDATLGQKRGEFGWDNEFAEHRVHVPAFRIGKYKVTNGQYLDFVRDGAPAPHFWTERAGAMVLPRHVRRNSASAERPGLRYASGSIQLRTLGAVSPFQPSRNFIARRMEHPHGAERPYPWGEAPPDAERGNFDFHRWDPTDVDSSPAGDSAFGVSQLIGNGWEWTRHEFGPFPGFEPFPFYPGYSKNFFDEEHYVLKGASPAPAPVSCGAPSVTGSVPIIPMSMPASAVRILKLRRRARGASLPQTSAPGCASRKRSCTRSICTTNSAARFSRPSRIFPNTGSRAPTNGSCASMPAKSRLGPVARRRDRIGQRHGQENAAPS